MARSAAQEIETIWGVTSSDMRKPFSRFAVVAGQGEDDFSCRAADFYFR